MWAPKSVYQLAIVLKIRPESQLAYNAKSLSLLIYMDCTYILYRISLVTPCKEQAAGHCFTHFGLMMGPPHGKWQSIEVIHIFNNLCCSAGTYMTGLMAPFHLNPCWSARVEWCPSSLRTSAGRCLLLVSLPSVYACQPSSCGTVLCLCRLVCFYCMTCCKSGMACLPCICADGGQDCCTAPERRGDDPGPASKAADMWAAGMCLHFLFSGGHAYFN